MVGRVRLKCSDRMAVIAKLAVVVVLDDQALAALRPPDARRSPPRGEGHSKWELVGGREDGGVGVAELLHDGPLLIDGHAPQPEAGDGGCRRDARQAVRFDRDGPRPVLAQHLAQQRESVSEARADHDPLGARAHAAGPHEVVGQGRAQLRPATWVGVVERGERRLSERAAGCAQPGRGRKGRDVGRAGAQVEAGVGELTVESRRRSIRVQRCDGGGDARPRTLARRQPTLSDELTVGCAYCIDMHTKDARAIGETEQRIYALPAWRETLFFNEKERAALAFTESVTLLATDHVPTEDYDAVAAQFSPEEIAALVSLIVAINAWNAIGVSTRAWAPGSYQP